MAAAYLDAAYPGGLPGGLAVARRNERRWDNVISMGRRRLNSPVTSSARLFDAAAAILGVRDLINYEGQAAVELEQLADPAEPGAYPARIDLAGTGRSETGRSETGQGGMGQGGMGQGGPLRVSGADLIRAVADDLAAGRRSWRHLGPVPQRRRRGHRGRLRGCCGIAAGWPRWRCPAGCSRTCCCSTGPSAGSSAAASASWCTPGCRATTAGSASARPPSPRPGTAPR